MKRVLKYIGFAIAIIIGLFYIVANHSISDEIKLECTGNFYYQGDKQPEEKVFFKFKKYRWWVGIWGDSQGTGYVQRESGHLDYIPWLEFVSGWDDIVFDNAGGAKSGRYSAMTRIMRYVPFAKNLFEGKCVDGK